MSRLRRSTCTGEATTRRRHPLRVVFFPARRWFAPSFASWPEAARDAEEAWARHLAYFDALLARLEPLLSVDAIELLVEVSDAANNAACEQENILAERIKAKFPATEAWVNWFRMGEMNNEPPPENGWTAP